MSENKQKIARIIKQAGYWMGVVSIGAVVGVTLQFSLAGWTPPPAGAPNSNVGAPITTGADPQTRTGPLTIGNNLTINGAVDVLSKGRFGGSIDVQNGAGINADGDLCTEMNGGKCLSATGGGSVTFISCSIGEYIPSCSATCPSGKTIIAFGQTGATSADCYGESTVSGGTLTVNKGGNSCNNAAATFGASCQ